MEQADMKFAAEQVKQLDEWAYGFAFGFFTGIMLTILCAVAITDKLK